MRTLLKCRALVVGINLYESGIAPLQSAASDALAVADLLIEKHGYQLTCLTDAEATGAAIMGALEEAQHALAEDEGFLFYFAGHGVAVGDGSDGPQGFLLPQGARATDDSTWLSMEVIRQALERLPCRHLLVVLDCCFAGAFRWSSSRDAVLVSLPLYDSQFARFLDGEAWQALTSASHDQRAADTLPGRRNTRDAIDVAQHSPFAAAFLRGLAGDADSARAHCAPDGVITATELYQFLFDELMPANGSTRQTPGLWPLRAGNRGEFVFLNPNAPLKTLPDPPLDDQNNPWLGLRAYSSADAGIFFGRRRVVDALLQRVCEPSATRFLVVVGASGTGKSSVVKAGLLPALTAAPDVRRQGITDWHIIEAPRLRADPVAQLEETIAGLVDATGSSRNLLLFDQFEELYTQCRDAVQREIFLSRLRQLVDRADGPLVLLTLRSDFEPRLANSEHFAAVLPAARFLVPTFSTDELREVVEAPLRAKALYFEPATLVDTLLDEVAAMPGALPLLSFALSEMYRHAQLRRRQTGTADRALSDVDYAATGGVIGALHKRAAMLHDQADADTKRSIQRVFLRMLSQEGARVSRRRVSLTELEYPDDHENVRVRQVLDTYVTARLLVIDQQYIEPAHDTLVVAWEALQEWLSASASQPLLRALWRAARDWDSGKRQAGLLWNNDPRLAQAEAIAPELNRLEYAFVRASVRRKKGRRRLLMAITILTIGALSFAALYSMQQADEARLQTVLAEEQLARAQQSEGRALLAVARTHLETSNMLPAAMSAAEAIGFKNFGYVPPSVRDPLLSESTPTPLLAPQNPDYVDAIRVLSKANLGTLRPIAWRELGHVVMGNDGALLAGINQEGQIEVRDFQAERISVLNPPTGNVRALLLSTDGRQLATVHETVSRSYEITLWRTKGSWENAASTLLKMPTELSPEQDLVALAFDPAGQRLAMALTQDIVMWQPTASTTGRWLRRGKTQGIGRQTSLSFTADGKALLSGGWHNRLTADALVDFESARSAAENNAPVDLRGQALGPEWTLWSENTQKGDFVNGIGISGDGSRLVIASANQIRLANVDGDAVTFDAASFTTRLEINHIALSADGSVLALEDAEHVRLLRLPSLELIGVLSPLTFRPNQVTSLQFFDGSKRLLVAGSSQVELFDVSGVADSDVALPLGTLPEELPAATNGAALRALIESGQIDPVVLALPDASSRPEGLSWEIYEDEYRFSISFTAPNAEDPDQPVERGSLQLSLQPESASLVAVGISQFEIRQLRGSEAATIEFVSVADQSLLFSHTLSDDEWGLDGMRFSEDGSKLLVKVSNFDGYINDEYAFSTLPLNLFAYRQGGLCQAPINLAPEHWLSKTKLMDCAD